MAGEYTLLTGDTESWGTQGTYFYGSLRVHYEVVYYPESNQSYVIMTPQFWTNANIGNDNRFFNVSGSSYAGIYGNGNKLYEFSSSYSSGNYMACGNAQNTWTSLSGSVGMVIQHDGSGNSSFTTAVYCSVIALGYPIGGGNYATLRDFGNTTSNSISVHANAPFSITYNMNGGSGSIASQGVYVGVSYTLSSTTPTRSGYTFLGWSTSNTATTASYTGGQSVTPNGNLALYAVWKKATYTVSYNANGGTGAPASQTKTYDVPLTLTTTKPSKATTTDTTYTVTYNYHNGSSNTTATAAKKTAYTFSQWNTKSDGTGTNYSSGGTYSANAAATLYARYTSSTSTAAVTLPTPTKTGYSLNGWYTAETGGTKIDNGGASYTPTGNITLHAQWKGLASTIATISSSVATQGNLTLTVTRMSSAYYHKATFKIGSTTMATSSAFATSLSYTIPRSWFTSYSSATSKTVDVSVQTYTTSACTPGTEVGAPATTTFTMTADSGMKPSVSSGWAAFAYYNTGTAASGIAGYVKGYSKAKVTFDSTKISLTNSPGATIASYAVTCLGSTDSSSPYYTPTLTGTSVTATCKVTDSRGRYATQDFTISVMDYAKPSISDVAVFRCNAGGTADEDGTYISVKATRSFSPLNSLNSCTLKAQIAPSGGSYGAATTLTSGTASKLGGGALSADTSYTVKIVAQDSLSNSATYYYTVPTRKWAMKFRSTGNGVAFGKAAETDNVFEVTPDWTVKLGTPLPVTSGGTGANTPGSALSNIGGIRPNLLDNWYFVGGGSQRGAGYFPINSKGQTTYTPNASNTYTIDRWRTGLATGTVTLYAGSMKGSNNFLIMQPIDVPLDMYGGKTVTLSILTSQGLWTATGTLPSSAPASMTQTATAYIKSGGTNIGYGDVQINTSGNISVRLRVYEGHIVYFWAVKLELGDSQTLAHQVNGAWVLNEVPKWNKTAPAVDYDIVTVSIGNISAYSYASAYTDITFKSGYDFFAVVPQYTNVGYPVAGTYLDGNPPSGMIRVIAGVMNNSSSTLNNVTATVRVLWSISKN